MIALLLDAYFKVSGNTLSGTGAIPLDAELDLGGPGGGSTADFNQINAPVISNGSYYGFAPIGLTVESSGNTVFNNIFDTTITIVSIDLVEISS